MIKVTYDGEYPCACMGTLTVSKDGKELYKKKFCCSSSGSVWFSHDYTEAHEESGELTWDDADKFPREIRDAVSTELGKVSVCCGGCI